MTPVRADPPNAPNVAGRGVPEVIWQPSAEAVEHANVTRFMAWLEAERGVHVQDYAELWRWSVRSLEEFWDAVWQFFEVRAAAAPRAVLADRTMPGARWFEGAELSYPEHVLRFAADDRPAIVRVSEDQPDDEISWRELRGAVGALSAALRDMGVGPGDRVVGYLPNVPEAVIAMLAVTAIGAVWAACAPDFGTASVIDRFAQLEPKVLIAAAEYRFGGRDHDRRQVIEDLRAALGTLERTIVVGDASAPDTTGFASLTAPAREPEFTPMPFEHPLWILFSSGTTGIPKGIVQSHGGILLEHLKSLGLCLDLHPDDTYFFFSSTSWMAWNYLVGGLLHGSTIVLYEGSPTHPGVDGLWEHAARVGATVLGMGSAYAMACQKAGVHLRENHDLSRLRTVIPTGAPLPVTGWRWLAEELPGRTRIDSICGGTDVCTAFIGGSPLLPVYEGEIACRWLGIAADSFGADGSPLVGEVGEFVMTEPMPSMPVALWNDPDGTRYREAYFDTFPGVWRQGDWVTISERGTLVVSGRSDATLNRGGVRLGSAEIYGAVERLPEVLDSLVVGLEQPDGSYYMPLFVVPADANQQPDDLRAAVIAAIRSQLSPRYVPDEIVIAPDIPRTLTGKKLEVPVKRILNGAAVEAVAAPGAVDKPDALRWFEQFGRSRMASGVE
jgi:acetoacetyl-CoA synthetase